MEENNALLEVDHRHREAAPEPLNLWANRHNNPNISYISNGSLGIEMDFMSMWSQVTEEQVKKIYSEFCIDIFLMAIVVTLLEMSI